MTYLAEHNDLELWGTDIGNAYLESYTKERICFVARGEFGELAGHTFMILKVLIISHNRHYTEYRYDMPPMSLSSNAPISM